MPKTENQKPETASETWFYLDRGQGPPLLLLHGLGASSFSWRDNLGPLSRHFRVIAPDIPPHGQSPAPLNGDYRLESLAQGVLDFLERLGIQETAIGGNSLGGGLALVLARERPDLVKALVLLAPAAALTRMPLIFYPLRLPGLWGRMAASLLGPWLIPGAIHLMYYRWDRITPEVVAGYAEPYRDINRRLALRRLCQTMEIWPLEKVKDLLEKVHQPCLLIWGEKDRILPPSQGEWLKARLPQARLHLLSKVGHAPQAEAPDLVNKIIIDFLESL